MTLTVVFALAAAISNAVNLMTQHSASAGAPKRERGWRLVGYLFRQPIWLAGWVTAAGAFAFQALALHDGQLSVVQPVLVTELVFVLVLRRVWIRQDVARAAWAAVLAVCAALAVFLTVAEPAGGHPAPETAGQEDSRQGRQGPGLRRMDLRQSPGGGGVCALPGRRGCAVRDYDRGRREDCPHRKRSGPQDGRCGSCPEEAGRKTGGRSHLAPSGGARGLSARQRDSDERAISAAGTYRTRRHSDGTVTATALGCEPLNARSIWQPRSRPFTLLR